MSITCLIKFNSYPWVTNKQKNEMSVLWFGFNVLGKKIRVHEGNKRKKEVKKLGERGRMWETERRVV